MVGCVLAQLAAIIDCIPSEEGILLVAVPIDPAGDIIDAGRLLLAELQSRDSRRICVGTIRRRNQVEVGFVRLIDWNRRYCAGLAIDDPSIAGIRIRNKSELGDPQGLS